MKNLACVDAHFYFYVDDNRVRLSLNELSGWNKEMDNKCAEDMKKYVADLYNVDVSKVRRISKKEYEELNSEEDDINENYDKEEGYDF